MPAPSDFKIIAIDGGAATGKSSTSRGLADKLDLMHVDTGAHYRTLTYAMLKVGASPESDNISELLGALSLDTTLEGRS
ncbi:MAG: (d)CMP kinase, partial [Opitutales bacterium]|nr:(d)CMP kinase [Opitutales bacterium]